MAIIKDVDAKFDISKRTIYAGRTSNSTISFFEFYKYLRKVWTAEYIAADVNLHMEKILEVLNGRN